MSQILFYHSKLGVICETLYKNYDNSKSQNK